MSKQIDVATGINGWMSDAELQWLAERAEQATGVIIEVGAYEGRTTKILAANSPGKVITIDPWYGNHYNHITRQWEYNTQVEDTYAMFCENLKEEIRSGKVEVYRLTSKEAANVLKNKGVVADFVFIDGDHTHPVVDHDINTYIQFVKSGGVYSGHDANTNHVDVNEALDKYLPDWKIVPNTTIWQYLVK